ncbi:amidohydrolase [Leucobacter tenebrionis]|uniref:amidohydrolase n=1 Tax=Leucobacter tenebrionis TaxID=2873270 RepID=UPI001CA678FF|nr:amidohydrolase [Leucobacter tenebrionis]QZY51504.1 amidohydrolase [Leucobacter tenebrionis]
MASLTHYRGGRIFTADDEQPWAESLLVQGGRIRFVGSTLAADQLAAHHPAAADVVELHGALVVPGFVEAHSHLVNLGRSLSQVDLLDAPDLAEVQRRVLEAVDAAPDADRILGRSWLLEPLAGAQPDRRMIDAVVADRPVYLVSNDLHSGWVNTAALRELGIDRETPDPEGGTIVRDAEGEATGLLLETAALVLMRGGVERLEDDTVRDTAVLRALESYRAAGTTAVADLGLRRAEFEALERAWDADALPIPVAGYLRVETSADPRLLREQLQRAVETRDRIAARALERGERDPMLRIAGIKVWIDGVIDSGTAAMSAPFSDGSQPAPLWTRELLEPVVVAADAAGLQVAMHAIGDAAVNLALDAIEAARRANGGDGPRHRIEHLEFVDRRAAHRIAASGTVASVQPVHSDPAVQGAWRRQLGDDRVERGYPWAEFEHAGALIALGTDAPTAPYAPLPNIFIAVTRRSPGRPDLPANHPALHLELSRALVAATRDAAVACGWGDSRGVLGIGRRADFAALDVDPFADGAEVLREATPVLTVVGGEGFPRT